MQGQYNMRSPAVKRLMKEAHELKDPTELYYAQPLEDNLFEWHFTLRGPEDSDFDGGIYHGRIVLPPDYPMKPPSIILLTPNGRFETNKKICLSISGHHPESWQPSWSIRTALLAIIGFMPTHGGGAIGSLDYTPEERKVLAKRSQDWKCSDCGDLSCKLKPLTAASEKASKEAKELAAQINFSGEKTVKSDTRGSDEPKSTPHSTAATITAAPGSGKDTAGAFRPLPPGAQFPWPVPTGWSPAGTNTCLGAVPRFPYPPYCMPPNFAASNSQRGASSGAQQMPFFPPAPFFPPFLGGMPPFPPTHYAQASHPQTPGAGQGSFQTSQVDQPIPSTSASCPATTSSLTRPLPPSPSPDVKVTSFSPAASPALVPSSSDPSAEQVGSTSSSSFAKSTSGTSTEAATSSFSTMQPNTSAATPPPASTQPTTELRQRQMQPTSPSSQSAATATGMMQGDTNIRQQHSDGTASFIMMILLGVAISLLLVRRLYLYYLSSDMQDIFEE